MSNVEDAVIAMGGKLDPITQSIGWKEGYGFNKGFVEFTSTGKVDKGFLWICDREEFEMAAKRMSITSFKEMTKMKYKFKVGDKVKVVMAGYGCGLDEIGTVSTITELGRYEGLPGYRVDNLENKPCDDFIGEDSFKLHSPADIKTYHQNPAAHFESISTVTDSQPEEQALKIQSEFKKAPDILSAGIKHMEDRAALRDSPVTSTMSSLYPDYYKSCVGVTELDVYIVHHLFNINDPSGCIQHASKKLLLSGVRTGGKSAYKDIKEARDTLTRKLQLMEQFEESLESVQ